MHHYIGIALGAIVTYVLLLTFHGGRFVGEPGGGYMIAVVGGAIVAALWPFLLGWWMARRLRARQRARIQSEVSRQVSAKTPPPPTH